MAVTAGLASVAVQAAPLMPFSQRPGIASALVPVVAFGKNSRLTPELFAATRQLDATKLRQAHAASGLIQCGDAHGAGQLTITTNVVTTAAHVFFDENGLPRASSCTFSLTVEGKTVDVPVEMSSIVAGSNNPYAVEPTHDWAVARLARRIEGVAPYTIAENIHANEPVTFIARGHIDWGDAQKLSFEDCLMHDQISVAKEGTREFSFDCETGDGASGGALMVDKALQQIGGILVGWRSNNPFGAQPFSRRHYNFAVTMEGGFREAVLAVARNVTAQK